MVELSIHLFGKPAWELDGFEGNDLPESFSLRLGELGDELKARLHETARIFDKLVKNGWQPYGTLYSIEFHKDITIEKAKRELKNLNLEDYVENLIEIEEEEEWEEKEEE